MDQSSDKNLQHGHETCCSIYNEFVIKCIYSKTVATRTKQKNISEMKSVLSMSGYKHYDELLVTDEDEMNRIFDMVNVDKPGNRTSTRTSKLSCLINFWKFAGVPIPSSIIVKKSALNCASQEHNKGTLESSMRLDELSEYIEKWLEVHNGRPTDATIEPYTYLCMIAAGMPPIRYIAAEKLCYSTKEGVESNKRVNWIVDIEDPYIAINVDKTSSINPIRRFPIHKNVIDVMKRCLEGRLPEEGKPIFPRSMLKNKTGLTGAFTTFNNRMDDGNRITIDMLRHMYACHYAIGRTSEDRDLQMRAIELGHDLNTHIDSYIKKMCVYVQGKGYTYTSDLSRDVDSKSDTSDDINRDTVEVGVEYQIGSSGHSIELKVESGTIYAIYNGEVITLGAYD